MNNNFIELERATTDNDACGIENALLIMSPSEHLQAIKELKSRMTGSSNLDIQITPGSTASNFEYSILGPGGQSKTELKFLANMLHQNVADLERSGQNARKGLPPVEIVHEKSVQGQISIDCRK